MYLIFKKIKIRVIFVLSLFKYAVIHNNNNNNNNNN
jgi:hypothetical protein